MSLTISLSVQPCAFKYFNSLASSSFDIKSPIPFTCLFYFFPLCRVSTFARITNRTAFPFLEASRGQGVRPLVCKTAYARIFISGWFFFLSTSV